MHRQGRQGNRGFVIVIALIALMGMSFFLLTGAATTTSTVKVSGNYNKTIDVFNVAEVGLAKIRPMLETTPIADLLDPGGTPRQLIPPTVFSNGTYEVYVSDNDDDANYATDIDGIVVVRSVGRSKAGGKVEIETHQQRMSDEIESPGNCTDDPTSCNGVG